MLVMDTGYRTPAILRRMLLDKIAPLVPRKGPMTKKGFFRKYDYIYDEKYDCYICPNNKTLSYSTTNREGYREYKSEPLTPMPTLRGSSVLECMTCATPMRQCSSK